MIQGASVWQAGEVSSWKLDHPLDDLLDQALDQLLDHLLYELAMDLAASLTQADSGPIPDASRMHLVHRGRSRTLWARPSYLLEGGHQQLRRQPQVRDEPELELWLSSRDGSRAEALARSPDRARAV